jgi:large subunit ribosomal protein L25
MEQFEIEVSSRTGSGSAEARRVRKSGRIPAIVYSHGEAGLPTSVVYNEFIKVARQAKSSQLFTIKSEDKTINGRRAVVKEVQKDHLQGTVLHVDFQAISENEELTIRVAVRPVGEAPGVKLDGGILTVVAHELSIRCLPKHIPQHLDVDISALRIGSSIHAEELKLPEGVKLAGNPGETIVSVVAVRANAEDEAAATPAAGAAAAPAAGAAAAAPAADAKKADAKK